MLPASSVVQVMGSELGPVPIRVAAWTRNR